MKKITGSIFLLMFSFAVSFSQTPTPTVEPSPTPAADTDVVKITTTLIQLDVTVTDKNGKIVSDLKPEDFEVFENDKKQTITNFSFINSVPEKQAAPSSAPNKISVPFPTVQLRPEQVRRTIALVVDDLGLSAESIQSVQKALKKFVDEQMQPNDLVAIIRTGSGVGSLQQFTSDKNLLYAAIEKIRWNPIGRGGVGTFAPIEPTLQELIQANTAIPSRAGANAASLMDDQVQAEKDRITAFNELREDLFTVGTLGAINYVVRGMDDLPGRKSIMLFSDGFSYLHGNRFEKRCGALHQNGGRVKAADRSMQSCLGDDLYAGCARVDARGFDLQDTPAALPSSLKQGLRTRSEELRDKQQGLSFLAEKRADGRFLILMISIWAWRNCSKTRKAFI